MTCPRLRSSAATPLFFATLRGIVVSTAAASALQAQSIIATGDINTAVPNQAIWNHPANLRVGEVGIGTLTISAGAQASTGFTSLGYGPDAEGSATVTGVASLWNTGEVYVGFDGKGTLRVDAGGQMVSSSSFIGRNAGSEGSVTISGSGSNWQSSGPLSVGFSGQGELRIEEGGEVTSSSGSVAGSTGSQSMVTVTGSGSKWTIDYTLSVSGEMWIEAGGEVSNGSGIMGSSTAGGGTVTVRGEGSKWSNSGDLSVASNGVGMMRIEEGGEVNNGIASVASGGGSKGSVTVTGPGSRWISRSSLLVGVSGEGSLLIEAGGEVTSVDGVVGLGAGSEGSVTVTGIGSKWTNNGQFNIGSSGKGTLLVEAGGEITSQGGSVGSSSIGEGLVTVTGAGSRWEDSGTLSVGYQGRGTLRIENEGFVKTTGVVNVGFLSSPEKMATVTVTGEGSAWESSSDLIVGFAGNGLLRIEAGGLVTAATFIQLGLYDAAVGTLDLGSGGTLEVGGVDGLRIGYSTAVFDWSGGTVRVIGSDFTTSLDATLTNNAAIDTNGFDATLSGVLSGTGSLTKDGAGVLTLTGANTYEGGTLVLGGSLVASVTSLPGNAEVDTGAFLIFDQAVDGTYTGLISGAGSVHLNGDGTVTFEAIHSYAGETQINAGALQATTSVLANRDVSVAADAGLIFNQADAGSYAGEISGAGGLVKAGAGVVNLTGNQTYAGPTLVNGGGLLVNGNLASTSVTVGSGALLGGAGIITGDVFVQGGGILAPGNSPGILTMGSLVLSAGSFTRMDIHGTTTAGVDYDQIRVTGEATLGGTLELLIGGAYVPQAGDSFVLIDADTITMGSDFAAVNVLGNALIFTTTITDDYMLEIMAVQTDFAGFALTANQRAVARNLDGDWTDSAMQPVVDALNTLPGSSLPDAFDRIAPEEYAALPRLAQHNTRALWASVRRRLAEVRAGSTGWSTAGLGLTDRTMPLLASVGDTADRLSHDLLAAQQAAPRRGFFVSGTGTFGGEDAGSVPGYDFASGSLLLGADTSLTPDLAVGIMAGYEHTQANPDNGGSIRTETARLGLYGTWSDFDGSWLNASAGGAYHWHDTRRDALGGTAVASPDALELNALLEAGRDFAWGGWTLTPSAGLDYVRLHVDGFNERGSLAPLSVESQTSDSLRSELALTLARRIQKDTTTWNVWAKAGWAHEFLDTRSAVRSRLASGAGGVFVAQGNRVQRDGATIGVGLQAVFDETLSASIGYSGDYNADYGTHSINASLRFRF